MPWCFFPGDGINIAMVEVPFDQLIQLNVDGNAIVARKVKIKPPLLSQD